LTTLSPTVRFSSFVVLCSGFRFSSPFLMPTVFPSQRLSVPIIMRASCAQFVSMLSTRGTVFFCFQLCQATFFLLFEASPFCPLIAGTSTSPASRDPLCVSFFPFAGEKFMLALSPQHLPHSPTPSPFEGWFGCPVRDCFFSRAPFPVFNAFVIFLCCLPDFVPSFFV